MTPAFSPDIIARVKDETDIVEFVRQHVTLKQAGSVYKGLCPFHREKTPSFIVTPSRQRWHCFGCGNGGDVISFVMEAEGLSFPEAVELLARPLDIDLSSWLKEDESEGERRAFHRANEAALQLWREAFWDDRTGSRARRYLDERGFGEKVLRDYDVGWAPGGSDWLAEGLKRSGVDEDLAIAADLLRRGDRPGTFAYFRNRIIFPIKNISRQVAGFGGRVIDQGEPKYLNSADSSYFTKGKLLYGFDASRMSIAREKSALLVEGYLDLLALAQAGWSNVVATCGTAFTEDQARLIRRGAPNVTLLFDGDKAGLKAAIRSADVALRNGLEPSIVTLPQGMDPADIVIERGADTMRELLAGAQGYIPLLRSLADERGGDRQLRERALRQALGTIAGIADPLRREYVLQEAAEAFGMTAEVLRDSLPQSAPARRRPAKEARDGGLPDEPPAETEIDDPGPRRPARRGGPVVRHRIGQPNAARIEEQLFAHVLKDGSGGAARVFVQERAGLEMRSAGARILASEMEAWNGSPEARSGVSPREFVESRWNTAGDRDYRGWVSRLMAKEDIPDRTDFVQVARDCLNALRRGQAVGKG